MPDFTDNESDEILVNSGIEQSAFASLVDIGLMMQFNFLKYFSRDLLYASCPTTVKFFAA